MQLGTDACGALQMLAMVCQRAQSCRGAYLSSAQCCSGSCLLCKLVCTSCHCCFAQATRCLPHFSSAASAVTAGAGLDLRLGRTSTQSAFAPGMQLGNKRR